MKDPKLRRELSDKEVEDLKKFISNAIPFCMKNRYHDNLEADSRMFSIESKDIPLDLASGNLLFVDEYWGNAKKFIGNYQVFLGDKQHNPIFCLNYAGRIYREGLEKDKEGNSYKNDIKKCIHQALMQENKKNPWRGPDHFRMGDYLYQHYSNSSVHFFEGRENITHVPTSAHLYHLVYHGLTICPKK
ncbi:MAG: DUF5680 domain-containing protein [Candidatus Nanoarchaeia archaeon]